MPKVSILVPVYNVEKYLRECLDSITAQTLEDIEIICINDGSTDSSAQILNDYKNKDERVRVITKENSGYGATMNKGLDVATGEYIGIVESDDFVEKTMFEDLYTLAKDNNLDIAKSDFYHYFTKEGYARHAGIIKNKFSGKVINANQVPEILRIVPSIWSGIYRRDFLEQNNIRFLETTGASYQDTSFNFKTLLSAKRVMFTPKAYLNYRQDNENSSVKSSQKVYAICEEWAEITKYMNLHPETKASINPVKLSTEFISYRWNLMRIAEVYKDDFISKYSETFKNYLKNGELKKGFFDIDIRKELALLLSDKAKYKEYIEKKEEKRKQQLLRRKQFSVRISSTRISVILFGKPVLEIGQ